MIYECHHLEKWANANIDLVEEVLEKNNKAVVIIAGASSSGKSYCAKVLQQGMEYNNHKSVVISLDSYNVGLSGIIPNKVNDNYFNGKLENIKEIRSRIKDIIYNVDFDKKYCDDVLVKIKESIKDLLSKEDLDKFITCLPKEWKLLNFDEPTVYDMKEASEDVKVLLNGGKVSTKQYSKVVSERVQSNSIIDGNDYDVIIVEGIYALTRYFLDGLDNVDTIKNFIDSNPKSLYLRRIIRDAKSTSASSAFTTKNYFKYIIPSYNEYIFPSSKNADVIFNNEMTFGEMRCGELFDARLELNFSSPKVFKYLIKNSTVTDIAYQRDVFFMVPEEANNNNTLRLRMNSLDKGKTYKPYNLVNKGVIKVRKDNRVIRPVNILIKEDDFPKIWSNYIECVDDFYRAGFVIGKINHRIRYNVTFKDQKLKISNIENSDYSIDFVEPVNDEIVEELKALIKKI